MNDEHGFDNTFGRQDGKPRNAGQSGFPAGVRNPTPTGENGLPNQNCARLPAPGQQDKAFLHIRQLDHLQTDAFPFCGLYGLLPGVAHKGLATVSPVTSCTFGVSC
jgi:hypothetical protein